MLLSLSLIMGVHLHCVSLLYIVVQSKAHFGVELGITFVGWHSGVEAEGPVVANEEGCSVHDITIVL